MNKEDPAEVLDQLVDKEEVLDQLDHKEEGTLDKVTKAPMQLKWQRITLLMVLKGLS